MLEFIGATLIVLLIILVIAFFAWLYVKILHKAGFSGWWAVLMFIPLVHFVMIWIFAFIDWPASKKNQRSVLCNR